MKITIPKLKAILLYFTENTNTRFLGKVKLMKLIYFLDFLHLKTYGSPITYDDYINLEHGPIPSTIKNLIDSADDDIDNSILADTVSIEKSDELNIRRIIPKRKLTERDRQYFSETELDILNKVCRRFGEKNTKYIEDESHKEAAWRETKLFEHIPYEIATRDPDCLVSKEEIKLLLEI